MRGAGHRQGRRRHSRSRRGRQDRIPRAARRRHHEGGAGVAPARESGRARKVETRRGGAGARVLRRSGRAGLRGAVRRGPRLVRPLLRLIRAPNLLIAAAGVLAGGWIALGRIAFSKELVFAAISAIAIGAVGNTWNDIRDVAADRVNRPGTRPLAARQLSRGAADLIVFDGSLLGLAFAGLVSGWLFLAALAALAVMFAYSPLLKPRPLLGNVAVAVVAGPPPLVGARGGGAPGGRPPAWGGGGFLALCGRSRGNDQECARAPADGTRPR